MKKNDQATKPPQKSVLGIEWDGESAAKITAPLGDWQRTDNLDQLVELVKLNPVALALPLVFKKIFALRRVLNQAGEEDLDGEWGVTLARGQEKLLARGEKRGAEKALYNILSVWSKECCRAIPFSRRRLKRERGGPTKEITPVIVYSHPKNLSNSNLIPPSICKPST